eukprot:2603211-Prymnesium_polylepis.1
MPAHDAAPEPACSTTAEQQLPEAADWVKWASLTTLIAQNSGLFIMLRVSRAAHKDEYASTVAVLLAEILKLVAAFILFAEQLDRAPSHTLWALWLKRRDIALLAVPAACYTAQNNLLYVAADHLSAPALQTLGQTKTLWTALFTVLLLKRSFSCLQVLSFFLLFLGVSVVQQEDKIAALHAPTALRTNRSSIGIVSAASRVLADGRVAEPDAAYQAGAAACLAAAALSGFASVFLEKVYCAKNSSLWALNTQLATISLPLQLLVMIRIDGPRVMNDGLLAGFHLDTWAVI